MIVSSVVVSRRIELRQGCRFISDLVRALVKLPGGVGSFLPCSVGKHMSKSRHIGWDQCSHGLTSRQLESCHHQYLLAVCWVWGFLEGAAADLLDGTLKLRYCTTVFTRTVPPLGFT